VTLIFENFVFDSSYNSKFMPIGGYERKTCNNTPSEIP